MATSTSLQGGYDSGQPRCQSCPANLTQTQHGRYTTDTQPCWVNSATTASAVWFGYGSYWRPGLQWITGCFQQQVSCRDTACTVCCHCTRTYWVPPSLHWAMSEGLGRVGLENETFSQLEVGQSEEAAASSDCSGTELHSLWSQRDEPTGGGGSVRGRSIKAGSTGADRTILNSSVTQQIFHGAQSSRTTLSLLKVVQQFASQNLGVKTTNWSGN